MPVNNLSQYQPKSRDIQNLQARFDELESQLKALQASHNKLKALVQKPRPAKKKST